MIPVSEHESQYTDAGSTGNKTMNVVQWLPIEQLIEVLRGLYEARERKPKTTCTKYPAYPTCLRGQVDPP